MAMQTSTKLTYDDYVLLPDDGRRYEIIDGELYVNPAPFLKHQLVVGNVWYALRTYFKAHGGGTPYVAPVDVLLSPGDIVEPDVVVVLETRRHIRTERNLVGAPDLLIEVLSDSTRRVDENRKRDLYARAGVQEYWIIDPDTEVIKIDRRAGETFTRVAEMTNGTITSPLLPGFSLEVSELFVE